jgi:hypothetical protein
MKQLTFEKPVDSMESIKEFYENFMKHAEINDDSMFNNIMKTHFDIKIENGVIRIKNDTTCLSVESPGYEKETIGVSFEYYRGFGKDTKMYVGVKCYFSVGGLPGISLVLDDKIEDVVSDKLQFNGVRNYPLTKLIYLKLDKMARILLLEIGE